MELIEPMVEKKAKKPKNPTGRRGQPVSLHPLSFNDAVTALAQVKPLEPKQEQPKAKSKKDR